MRGVFYKSLLVLLLIVSNIGFANAQTLIKKDMTELKPSKNFTAELSRLMKKVEKCDYYSSSLVWNISVTEVQNGCIIGITMQQEINTNDKYTGFFYIDDVLFVVSGFLENSLFTAIGNKELEFSCFEKPKNVVIQVAPEDYSTWIYLFNGTLILKKEFLIPCN